MYTINKEGKAKYLPILLAIATILEHKGLTHSEKIAISQQALKVVSKKNNRVFKLKKLKKLAAQYQDTAGIDLDVVLEDLLEPIIIGLEDLPEEIQELILGS